MNTLFVRNFCFSYQVYVNKSHHNHIYIHKNTCCKVKIALISVLSKATFLLISLSNFKTEMFDSNSHVSLIDQIQKRNTS